MALHDSQPHSDALPWGRRYLVCPPSHFGVLYEINPWMHVDVRIDPDRALMQWEQLVSNLERAGAEVERLDPEPGLPDMVFTANAGLVDGERFVVSRYRHPERRPESSHASRWFQERGFQLVRLSDPTGAEPFFEGAGDALPFRGALVAGYRHRSEFAAHAALADQLGVKVHSLDLVDPRFYHVDLTLCPLDDRRAIVNPHAWTREDCELIQRLVPEPLVLELEEALAFSANSVVVGRTILMPACSPRLGRQLERWGFDLCVSPVDEFQKAGGAVRCLTLALDVELGQLQSEIGNAGRSLSESHGEHAPAQ